MAADLIQSVTDSPWVFLLALNAALLVAGCLLDIISAIVVVVPRMLPVAASFGIDPVHLGIIFLANMELGYLTPPVGMNLYLSSFRFEKPLMKVFRAALPFFLINLIAVLVITFVPAISVGVVEWLMP
jgi:TRAP-type C4-dicarboxylate transport system permease large subunit